MLGVYASMHVPKESSFGNSTPAAACSSSSIRRIVCTCQPVSNTIVLDLPDAGGLRVDIADGSQLMREVCLLADKANGIGVVWTQGLWLTIHLCTAGMLQEQTVLIMAAVLYGSEH